MQSEITNMQHFVSLSLFTSIDGERCVCVSVFKTGNFLFCMLIFENEDETDAIPILIMT